MKLDEIKLIAGKESQFALDLKEYYDNRVKEIGKISGITGIDISKKLTDNADFVIQSIYEQISQEYNLSPEISIVALGSYGREELNPFSDIDILFVHAKENDAETEELITKMLYILWDIKLVLGHSSRTIKNIISMANTDLVFKTSIISPRYICGDKDLFKKVNEAVEKVFNKNRFIFYQNLLNKLKFHEKSLGNDVLLKEPMLKDSLGALRGLHLIRWLGYNFFNNSKLFVLVEQGIISEKKWHKLAENLDFLLCVRSRLHYLANRKEDILLLEFQEKLAQNVELTKKEIDRWRRDLGIIKIEHFMREYYKRSKEVFQVVTTAMENFDRAANKYRQFSRFFNKRKFIDDQFMIIDDKLYFRKKMDSIETNPLILVEIFNKIAHYDCKLSFEVEDYIKQNSKKIDPEYRNNPDVFNLFVSCFKYHNTLYNTLSIMHHVGFLANYLPFFDELDCTVQHDYYHSYTVDEHTLQGVKKIEEIFQTDDRNFYYIKNLLLSLDENKIKILIFAILFHDIGKGRPGNHVTNGEGMIDYIVDSFPFTEREKELLVFLVNEHLTMVHISQRRDINDLKVIYFYANKVKEQEKLDLMFLLSYADMASVGPGVFALWKGDLLRELYNKVSAVLDESIGKLPTTTKEDFEKIKSKILDNTPEVDQEFALQFFENEDSRYFIDNEIDEIHSTISILKNLNHQPVIINEKLRDSYRLKFFARDEIGLFARITLVLAKHGVNIHNANIYSKIKGYAINYFNVGSSFSNDVISEQRWKYVKRDLSIMMTKDLDYIERYFEEKKINFPKPKTSIFKPKTKVIVDNQLSDQFSIFEIHTHDNIGVLYMIGSIFSSNNVSIKSAFIHTRGSHVIDTFYVEDPDTGKLTNEVRINELKSILLQRLSE